MSVTSRKYPVSIYNSSFVKVAEIDDYIYFNWKRKWRRPDEWVMHVSRYATGVDQITTDSIIVFPRGNENRAGVIDYMSLALTEEGKLSENWELRGSAYSGIFQHRIIYTGANRGTGYDVQTGAGETVMRYFVDAECISVENPDRVVPDLVLAPDQARGASVTYSARLQDLAKALEEICLYTGLGYEVEVDLSENEFVFTVYQGKDLSPTNTDDNSPVTFTPEFGNVKLLNYRYSRMDSKNIAIGCGQGEGAARLIVPVYKDINARFEHTEDYSTGTHNGTEVDADGNLVLSLSGTAEDDNFSGNVAGNPVSGWTERWASGSETFLAQDEVGATGGRVGVHTNSDNARRFWSLDAFGSIKNAEITAKLKADGTTGNKNRVQARCSGSATNETGYFVELINGSAFQLCAYAAGSLTTIKSISYAWSADTYYNVKLSAVNNTIRAKIWDADETEPAEWIIDVEDGTIPYAGYWGIGTYTSGSVLTYDFVNLQEIAYSPGYYESADIDYSDARIVRGSLVEWEEDKTAGTSVLVEHQVDGGDWLPEKDALLFSGPSYDNNILIGDSPSIQNLFDDGGVVEAIIRTTGYDRSMDIYNKYATTGTVIRPTRIYVDYPIEGYSFLYFQFGFSGSSGIWRTSDRIIKANETYRVSVFFNSNSDSNNPIIYIYNQDGTGGVVDVVNVYTPSGTRLSDAGYDAYIGGRTYYLHAFDGMIDDVRFWNTTRTKQQIEDNAFTELTGSEPGLVCYLKMNEGSGSTVADSTANGNDGTITGATWTTREDVNGSPLPGVNIGDDLDGVNGKVKITLDPGSTPYTPTVSPFAITINGRTTTTGMSGYDVREFMIDARDLTTSDEVIQRCGERLNELGVEEIVVLENLPGSREQYIQSYAASSQSFRQHPATWISSSEENDGVVETAGGHLTLTALTGYDILTPHEITKVELGTGSTVTWDETKPAGTDIKVYFGLSDDSTTQPPAWYEVTNGGSIDFITNNYAIKGKYLWPKVTLETTDAGTLPEMIRLYVTVNGLNAVWDIREGTFTYLTDYKCGDIVQANYPGIVEMDARIIEVDEVYDEKGESHRIILGREVPDLKGQIRGLFRNTDPELRR